MIANIKNLATLRTKANESIARGRAILAIIDKAEIQMQVDGGLTPQQLSTALAGLDAKANLMKATGDDAVTLVTAPKRLGRNMAEMVPLPTVLGMDVRAARTLLEAAGFTLSQPIQEESAQPVGTVLAQTPEAGTVVESDAVILLTVAEVPA